MAIPTSDLVRRAITAFMRKPGAQTPSQCLSGAGSAGGLDYIVLRDFGGVVAVYRVMPHSQTLKRLHRWPRMIE